MLRAITKSPQRKELAFLAGVVVMVGMLALSEGHPDDEGTRSFDALAAVLLTADVVALAFRRRWPLVVAWASLSILLTWYHLGYGAGLVNLPLLVALYTVAVTGDRRRTVVIGALMATVVSVSIVVYSDEPDVFFLAAVGWMVCPLLLGELVKTRQARTAELRERAERAEADREAEAVRRVTEERLRIAREIHDVVAHTISAMTIQAGVAADALDGQPEVAREALQSIRAAGRDAMGELRATVALLRDGPANADTAPAPGLDQLHELVDITAAAGVEVAVTETGPRRRLPAVVELTGYRIVQEALTNVARHAAGNRAEVRLDFGPDALVVEVENDGPPAHGFPDGQGFGLRGMDERVAALGGTVEHGPRPGGGFLVRARLPLGGGQTSRDARAASAAEPAATPSISSAPPAGT